MTHILSTTEIQGMFSNLTKLAAISLVLPMSTVDYERGFSALSRIKTDLHNRLSSRILNDLITITVEGPPPSEVPFEQACESGRVGGIAEWMFLFTFLLFQTFSFFVLQCQNNMYI